MDSMILLLGGNGYVGGAFAAALARSGVPWHGIGRRDVDFTDGAALLALLRASKPAFVVNCAGYTGKPNVDACEDHKAACLLGNAVLPGVVAEACAAAGVPWGHVSSGCIYQGGGPRPEGFREDDPPNFSFRAPPCSFYSGTKALGEEVLAGAPDCHIWRLRIPFSEVDNPRNYLSKLLNYRRLLDARNSLSHLDEFAEACLDCWRRRLPFGTWNITQPGSITAREITEMMRATGVARREFAFFASDEEFHRLATRTPRSNCVLDVSKALAHGLRLTPVHAAVERALRSWRPLA